ncbi:MAG: hypothetical protein K2I82_07065 [Ruminococcus sp.]|nr:hypothetical protein [Ruminococcus sp.]
MRIVTTKQMTAVEDMSEKLGVTKKMLMQNAGKKIAERIMEITANEHNNPEDTNVVFLAGGGNNGGDCFACACILAPMGYNITVVNLIKSPSTDLSKEYYSALPNEVRIITDYQSEKI